MRYLALLLALICEPAFAQQVYLCQQCGKYHYVQQTQQTQQVQQVSSEAGAAAAYVVNRDQRAYNHALAEARLLARRRYRGPGHPMGVAPGCRYSGTGVSSAPRPNHCYMPGWRRGRQRGLPDSRIVARAVVYSGGRYYWSAHYR